MAGNVKIKKKKRILAKRKGGFQDREGISLQCNKAKDKNYKSTLSELQRFT